MNGWWLVGVLGVALGLTLWRWRVSIRGRRVLLAEVARLLAIRASDPDPLDAGLTLADAAFDALVIVDDQHQVLALNTAARDLFPHIQTSDGSRKDRTLIALTHHHEIDALAAAALAGDEDLDQQMTVQDRLYRVRALALPESGVVALALRDVEELHRLARARRDMVANVSHELRTPITSIRLLADTLLGGALRDDKQAPQLVDKILAETSTLEQMAQELLDLSMIESGQALMRLVPRPASVLLGEAASRLSEQTQRKSQVVTIQPCEGVSVLADPEMVTRVLTNLLHNAIKFAPQAGHITMGCELSGEWVRLSVSDDGPGIPTNERQRVFERFYRANRARGGSGTGLGLAIARHIVEAHGGQIWVAERRPGEAGAELVFTLPRAGEA